MGPPSYTRDSGIRGPGYTRDPHVPKSRVYPGPGYTRDNGYFGESSPPRTRIWVFPGPGYTRAHVQQGPGVPGTRVSPGLQCTRSRVYPAFYETLSSVLRVAVQDLFTNTRQGDRHANPVSGHLEPRVPANAGNVDFVSTWAHSASKAVRKGKWLCPLHFRTGSEADRARSDQKHRRFPAPAGTLAVETQDPG